MLWCASKQLNHESVVVIVVTKSSVDRCSFTSCARSLVPQNSMIVREARLVRLGHRYQYCESMLHCYRGENMVQQCASGESLYDALLLLGQHASTLTRIQIRAL